MTSPEIERGHYEHIANLPYYKIFTSEERIAAKASGEYKCVVCGDVAFYCDIANLQDVLPPCDFVCVVCRRLHRRSFEEKRMEYFDNQNKQSTN